MAVSRDPEISTQDSPWSLLPLELQIPLLQKFHPETLLTLLVVNKETRNLILDFWRRGYFANKGLPVINLCDQYGQKITDEKSWVKCFKWLVFHVVLTEMRQLLESRKNEFDYRDSPGALFAEYGEWKATLFFRNEYPIFCFTQLMQTILCHPDSLNVNAFKKMAVADWGYKELTALTKLTWEIPDSIGEDLELLHSMFPHNSEDMFPEIFKDNYHKRVIRYLFSSTQKAMKSIDKIGRIWNSDRCKNYAGYKAESCPVSFKRIASPRSKYAIILIVMINRPELLGYLSPYEYNDGRDEYMQSVIALFDFDIDIKRNFMTNRWEGFRMALLQAYYDLYRFQPFFNWLQKKPSLIFEVCEQGNLTLLEFIIANQHRLKPNLKIIRLSDTGNTLLHTAIAASQLSIIRCLLRHGIDATTIDPQTGDKVVCKNNKGQTPRELADGKPDVIAILNEFEEKEKAKIISALQEKNIKLENRVEKLEEEKIAQDKRIAQLEQQLKMLMQQFSKQANQELQSTNSRPVSPLRESSIFSAITPEQDEKKKEEKKEEKEEKEEKENVVGVF